MPRALCALPRALCASPRAFARAQATLAARLAAHTKSKLLFRPSVLPLRSPSPVARCCCPMISITCLLILVLRRFADAAPWLSSHRTQMTVYIKAHPSHPCTLSAAMTAARTCCLMLLAASVLVAVMLAASALQVSPLQSCVSVMCGQRLFGWLPAQPAALPSASGLWALAKTTVAARKAFTATAALAAAAVAAASCVSHGVRRSQPWHRTLEAVAASMPRLTSTPLGWKPPSSQQPLALVLASVLVYGPPPVFAGR